MQFYRNWVALDEMSTLLVLWLMVVLVIFTWLLWTERNRMRNWFVLGKWKHKRRPRKGKKRK